MAEPIIKKEESPETTITAIPPMPLGSVFRTAAASSIANTGDDASDDDVKPPRPRVEHYTNGARPSSAVNQDISPRVCKLEVLPGESLPLATPPLARLPS